MRMRSRGASLQFIRRSRNLVHLQLQDMETFVDVDAVTPDSTPSTSSIFGSPTEPIFTENKHTLGVDLLQDSLTLLASKNDEALSAVQESPAEKRRDECLEFRSGYPILFLFELCKHFKLSPEVQYRAADLFHRFMTSHIVELYQHVEASAKSSSPIHWSDVEKRLKHQIILRAVSCVQVASKLSSHYHLVTLNKARSFLTSCGFRYAAGSIVQSEVRVLKTLEYKVHYPTSLEYVEVLLGSLVHNDKTVPAKHLHALSLKVLDVFYLCRRQIHEKLQSLSTPKSRVQPEITTAVENDKMLLAASVITAAGFILGQSHTKQISGQLSQITCIVSEDIITLASILLEEVFTDNPSLESSTG